MNATPPVLAMTKPLTLAVLHTQLANHRLKLRVASGFWSRFRGLMLARPLPADAGLLITRCTSVHTCFMRYALDVVYLDATGRVTQCVARLRPWRMHASSRAHGRARHVLELAAGSIERLGIRAADRLEHPILQRALR